MVGQTSYPQVQYRLAMRKGPKERWRPKEGENPWISDLDKDVRQQPWLTRGPSAVLWTLKREVNCTYNLISDMNPRSISY